MDGQDDHEYDDQSNSPSPRRGYGSPDSGTGMQSCIRFLISNAEAGSVIGKGGSTISEFQNSSGARIQLSRNHEFFPGTTDRIVVLSGSINDVMHAFEMILTKILKESEDEGHHDPKTNQNQIKLVVPNTVCGAIIGKAGATIKSFVEETGANIKLSSQADMVPGLADRTVTVTGNLHQQLDAVRLILMKLSEDSNYGQYASAPISYAGLGMMGLQNARNRFSTPAFAPIGYVPFGAGSKGLMSPVVTVQAPYQIMPVLDASPRNSVVIAVPDEHIGAIVGRGGKTLTEIQQASGATIKISDRGDFVAGTKNRKINLTGTNECIQRAQMFIKQKMDEYRV